MRAHTRPAFAADAAIPTFPITPAGSPGFRVMSVQVLATVSGLEDSALRSARYQLPRRAVGMPDRGVNDVGIGWIENEIECARRIAAKENFPPALSAIGGLEDSALGVRTPNVSERGNVDDVRILWTDADASDLPGVSESDVLPRFACVSGFEDTVAVRDIPANGRFTGADVDDVGVGLAYGDRADRAAEVFVGDGCPRHSAVGGLEDSATGGAEVILHRTRSRAGDGNRPAASKGTDLPPAEPGECRRIVCLMRGG